MESLSVSFRFSKMFITVEFTSRLHPLCCSCCFLGVGIGAVLSACYFVVILMSMVSLENDGTERDDDSATRRCCCSSSNREIH